LIVFSRTINFLHKGDGTFSSIFLLVKREHPTEDMVPPVGEVPPVYEDQPVDDVDDVHLSPPPVN
jgi:hypothetical protein